MGGISSPSKSPPRISNDNANSIDWRLFLRSLRSWKSLTDVSTESRCFQSSTFVYVGAISEYGVYDVNRRHLDPPLNSPTAVPEPGTKRREAFQPYTDPLSNNSVPMSER